MSLEQWLRSGWLQPFESTVAEIQKGFQVVDREISDAQVHGLSADGRFKHAYDAALQLTTIALKVSGYVVKKGQGHHKHRIDSLRYTLGAPWSTVADHIERCSRLKGQVVYEEIGVVSEEEASDLLDAVKQLRSDVIDWLKMHHSVLLPPGL
ncbi:MAG: hypothetical protein WD403_15730 [Pirellulales bacterium]